MSSPTTAVELLSLLADSSLIAPHHLAKLRKQVPESDSPGHDATVFAKALVHKAILTPFQARKLLAGRADGFFINKYRIMDLLGEGGMGKVFLAEQTTMKRPVALKLVQIKKAEEGSTLARFTREARAVARLRHPNITQAYDFDQCDQYKYIAMEFIEGLSLQELVQKVGAIPWAQAVDYVCQAAAGLAHAQEAGLVHRDIKPGNLMIETTGLLKILDLGLVVQHADKDNSLTLAGKEVILGTADYVSPEQALDSHAVDIRTDIYSLGCVMYFMLTASPPFAGKTAAQKLMAHQTAKPKPIQRIAPDVPGRVIELINRMIEKNPEDRFQSPDEVIKAFQPYGCRVEPPFDPAYLRYSRQDIEKHIRYGAEAPASTTRIVKSQSETRTEPVIDTATPIKPAHQDERPSPENRSTAIADQPRTKRTKIDTPTPDIRKSTDRRPKNKQKHGIKMAIAGCCCFLIVAATITATVAVTGSSASKAQDGAGHVTKNPNQSRIVLGPNRGRRALNQAIANVFHRGTIVLKQKPGGWHLDPVVINGNKLPNRGSITIRGDGPNVQIRKDRNQPILRILGARNCVIRNLILDGNGRTGPLLEIEGSVAGLKLQDVTLRNVNGEAIRFISAQGAQQNRIKLTNVVIEKGKDSRYGRGITFVSQNTGDRSRYVDIVASRMAFNNNAGILISQPVEHLRVQSCTFLGGQNGIRFTSGATLSEPAGGQPIDQWRVSGWWPLNGAPSFNPEQPPPPDKQQIFNWKMASLENSVVKVIPVLGKQQQVKALAWTTFRSDKEGMRRIYLGADDELTVWVNGNRIFEHKGHQGHMHRQYSTVAHFRRGENLIWAQLINGASTASFSAIVAKGETPATAPDWRNVLIEGCTFDRQSYAIAFEEMPLKRSTILIQSNLFRQEKHYPIVVRRSTRPLARFAILSEQNEDRNPHTDRATFDDARAFHLIPLR